MSYLGWLIGPAIVLRDTKQRIGDSGARNPLPFIGPR